MTESQKQKVIAVVGPTASGKSDLSIKIARKFNGEIISADSRQVYRGMDIGTGKVTSREQRLAKHHLLDVVSPKKVFTVYDFKKLGEKAIKEILKKKKVPIIVGGTGFYIDILVNNITLPEVPPNKKLRAKLEKLSAEQLYSRLLALDSRRAKTIDRRNKHRLIRALEIVDSIGKVPPLNTNHSLLTANYNVLWLGLKPKNIEKRIKIRLEKRLKQGLAKEVRSLLIRGVSKKRLHDFGLEYRQISEYLASEKCKVKSVKNFKKSEFYQKLLRDIIKYSKRQMTWFRRNKEINWIKNFSESAQQVKDFIKIQ